VTRVLLIEDHASARRGWSDYLGALGYSVLEAPDGETGLTLAFTTPPDIVVLDLGLPDIDGWSVARRLKANPATAGIPLIALTGADLPHERASALRAGCDLHLPKPCPPAALLEAIERALPPSRPPADGAGR
jgi:CheY-like chemotaxis protein